MKKTLIALTIAGLGLAGCSGNTTKRVSQTYSIQKSGLPERVFNIPVKRNMFGNFVGIQKNKEGSYNVAVCVPNNIMAEDMARMDATKEYLKSEGKQNCTKSVEGNKEITRCTTKGHISGVYAKQRQISEYQTPQGKTRKLYCQLFGKQ